MEHMEELFRAPTNQRETLNFSQAPGGNEDQGRLDTILTAALFFQQGSKKGVVSRANLRRRQLSLRGS
jgi:hypothetical protein